VSDLSVFMLIWLQSTTTKNSWLIFFTEAARDNSIATLAVIEQVADLCKTIESEFYT